VHFLVAGLLLFIAVGAWRQATSPYRIHITPGRVRQLALDYRLQFGQEPSPAALARLVDTFVDEEVLYRQGILLGLERDDEIVRRRVVQKMQFLEQDRGAPAEPSQAQLQAYYDAHRLRYATPERVSFSNVYFSPDKGGDGAARRRAVDALARLGDRVARAPERGDPFPDLYDYSDFGPDAARRLFGDTAAARALFLVPVGHWAGPFRSAYGWHLFRVGGRKAAAVPPLSVVRDQVRADEIAADQAAANGRSFQALKGRFTIIRDDLPERP
jgi:hypothetical protein